MQAPATASIAERRTRALALLYRAVGASAGIAVSTNDPVRARNEFYRVRQQHGDPALQSLRLVLSPTARERELFLIRTDGTVPAAAGGAI